MINRSFKCISRFYSVSAVNLYSVNKFGYIFSVKICRQFAKILLSIYKEVGQLSFDILEKLFLLEYIKRR